MTVITEIKSRLNIVDIVSGYVKLEKAGSNFKGCCPLHNEKSASFFVSPSRQTYHCFGCNRGGDIFSFIEELEGIDFRGALKVLADRAGVVLIHENISVKNDNNTLYGVLDYAAKFYEAVLLKFPEAHTYLKNRGLTDATIKQFRIGFAPDEWSSLRDFLFKKGIPDGIMERAGLTIPSKENRSEKSYDRFRGRLMFPITDTAGRVAGFSGRVLIEGVGKTLGASSAAKYVNSPETDVFHKSRVLFGFSFAKEAIRRADTCVIVEGQMDLILSHQAAIINTVASSGTALSTEHLDLIKRFTKNIVLAFDADTAGITAAHRAILLALAHDMSVRIAQLPTGMDPADVIRTDPLVWVQAVNSALPVIDFYLDLIPKLYLDKSTQRAHISTTIIPFIALLKSSIDQGHYVGEISKLLSIKEEPVWEEVKKSRNQENNESGKQEGASLEIKNTIPIRDRIARTIEGILLWQESISQRIIDSEYYRKKFSVLTDTPIDIVHKKENSEELIFEVETRFQGNIKIKEELEDLFEKFEKETLRDLFSKKMVELKEKERAGDTVGAEKLLIECQDISKKFKN